MMEAKTFQFISQVRLQAREEGREEGRKEGHVEGRIETLAAAIFKVLDGRGIAIDQDSRARIESCCEADTLETWLDRAVIVVKAADLSA
jgi:hypothetical protein